MLADLNIHSHYLQSHTLGMCASVQHFIVRVFFIVFRSYKIIELIALNLVILQWANIDFFPNTFNF